jgi:hypothetical protein
VLFGTDPARRPLLRQAADSAGFPRAAELEQLSERWLDEVDSGTDVFPRMMRKPSPYLAPLNWMGLHGFHDRAAFCEAM